MADPSFVRPTVYTDERLREAMEKQQRQKLLREELDSQRAQQREARAKMGLPVTTNEPMTRAQRHRQRLAEEQLEMERQLSIPAPVAPFDNQRGAFSLPQLGQSRTNVSLPAVRGTPRTSMPQEETVYGWGDTQNLANRSPQYASPRFPTPPQQALPPNVFSRNPNGQAPRISDERFDATLTTAPPPHASQAELAAWLADATERIRKARAVEPPRAHGPATRGTNFEVDDSETETKKIPRHAPTPKNAQRDARTKAIEERKVAKLEATLAGQAAEVARLLTKQREWEKQVDQLKGELKNARQREKQLVTKVMPKPKEKRAETAPKPSIPIEARGSSKAREEKRPITAGVLDAEDQRSAQVVVAEEFKASYRSRKGLPKSPVDELPSPKQKKNKQNTMSPPKTTASQNIAFHETTASLTFAQLLSFAETKMVSHRQVQQLWELFSGSARKMKSSSFAPDDEFAQPLETFETYEDLIPDEDE